MAFSCSSETGSSEKVLAVRASWNRSSWAERSSSRTSRVAVMPVPTMLSAQLFRSRRLSVHPHTVEEQVEQHGRDAAGADARVHDRLEPARELGVDGGRGHRDQ